MFEWWRERKREQLLAEPCPEHFPIFLRRNVANYLRLEPAQQQRLLDSVRVFVAEKHWEGCGGLTLSEEMQVTIAGQACLLVLELPHRLYENVESIFVYPSAVVRPEAPPGVFVRSPGLLASGPIALYGEAHVRGPVVLAWDRVLRDGRSPGSGHNLVYHEFAHKLDMLDGQPDGTPPLSSRAERERWQEVCARVYLALGARSQRGERTFIDEYGATSEAEFFAVATEHFFDQPRALASAEPELYGVLQSFYRQDPAARATASEAG